MSRTFSFLALIIVLAVGAYLYMKRTQSVMMGGTTNPTSAPDLIGVQNDLLAIAQAERTYAATNGKFASIDQLRADGALSMKRESRGFYTYSSEVSDTGFRIVATYSGPENTGMPKTLSVDQDMEIKKE